MEINWIEENIIHENLFIIVNDSSKQVKMFIKKKQFSFPVYYCDTTTLPLKYKKFLYPYTIEIIGDSIRKSFIGNIKNLYKE